MSSTFLYAAYGSNLHPVRLRSSERCPCARLLGTCVLSGWRLFFRKRSFDGSAKCDAKQTGDSAHELQIALYDIPSSEEPALDAVEGLGHGYRTAQVPVTVAGEHLRAKVYLAQEDFLIDDVPYDWYKQMVVLGVAYHGFSVPYQDAIWAARSKADPNPERAGLNWALVERMRLHGGSDWGRSVGRK